MIRWIAFVAGLAGAAGVAVGAFAAHGLAEKLAEDGFLPEEVSTKLATCDVAVRYHLTHAVALLALSAAPNTWSPKRRGLAAIFFLLGLGMFCGILYVQSILGLKGFHWVVPFGGLCFMLGWLTTAASAWTQPRSPTVA